MKKWSVRTIKFPYLGVQFFFFSVALVPEHHLHQILPPRLQPMTTYDNNQAPTNNNHFIKNRCNKTQHQ